MSVSRAVSEEMSGGESMWRFDTVPRNQPNPIERLTAWFDDDDFHLRITEAILHSPDGHTFRVRTTYRPIEGIDLPIQRTVSGTGRVRRRARFFTLVFDQIVEYTDYEVVFSE